MKALIKFFKYGFVSILFFTLLKPDLYAEYISIRNDSIPKKDKFIYLTLKYGMGGFSDDRSEIGKLGGGQLALYAKLAELPLGLSISSAKSDEENGSTWICIYH